MKFQGILTRELKRYLIVLAIATPILTLAWVNAEFTSSSPVQSDSTFVMKDSLYWKAKTQQAWQLLLKSASDVREHRKMCERVRTVPFCWQQLRQAESELIQILLLHMPQEFMSDSAKVLRQKLLERGNSNDSNVPLGTDRSKSSVKISGV